MFPLAFFAVSAALAAPLAPCGSEAPRRILVVAPSGAVYTTIQGALNDAMPGDLVEVRPGRYKGEITFPRSGSSGACISLHGQEGASISRGRFGLRIADKDYISVQSLDLSGISGGDLPTGISVEGSSSHIELRQNNVHGVTGGRNAHGIAFYGTSVRPISDVLVEGNEIHHCGLGQSETLALNGNVESFQVSNNKVHDNDNIGIDVIGYEGTGPSGLDYPRNGTISGNQVWNVSSGANPTYHGARSADGIYVDGGQGIVIEGNRVTNCDVGVEVASEHRGKSTQGVMIRGNAISGSYQGNIMMGGYDATRGSAGGIVVEGNALEWALGDGEIIIQNNTNGVQIKGNRFRARTLNVVATGRNNANIIVQGNTYSSRPTSGRDLALRDRFFPMLYDR